MWAPSQGVVSKRWMPWAYVWGGMTGGNVMAGCHCMEGVLCRRSLCTFKILISNLAHTIYLFHLRIHSCVSGIDPFPIYVTG